ncbi:MAG: hypothetical protein JWR65_4432 [Massilia sp.]|jgi:hypothetical protein|nr:hypothetical protein [Massilia sp.]
MDNTDNTSSKDSKLKQSTINTETPIKEDGVRRMPHERDESPDGLDQQPRGVMKQAAADLEQGLVDTDMRGTPGLPPAGGPSGQAEPREDAADGMRGQIAPVPPNDNDRK